MCVKVDEFNSCIVKMRPQETNSLGRRIRIRSPHIRKIIKMIRDSPNVRHKGKLLPVLYSVIATPPTTNTYHRHQTCMLPCTVFWAIKFIAYVAECSTTQAPDVLEPFPLARQLLSFFHLHLYNQTKSAERARKQERAVFIKRKTLPLTNTQDIREPRDISWLRRELKRLQAQSGEGFARIPRHLFSRKLTVKEEYQLIGSTPPADPSLRQLFGFLSPTTQYTHTISTITQWNYRLYQKVLSRRQDVWHTTRPSET
jgi:hypothetical protein